MVSKGHKLCLFDEVSNFSDMGEQLEDTQMRRPRLYCMYSSIFILK